MPPKKQQPNKKTESKQKDKIIEDKTFGLKNKKGAKQQKFIQHVQHQVKYSGQSKAKLEAEKHEDRKKKAAAATDELGDLNKLLKPVQDMPKVGKDVDPKSVLCMFFKQGLCSKGAKCKFSHDLAVERRSEKKSVYVDSREMDEDTMENWDEAKLNEVVETKHGEAEKLKPKTAIICKYFLEALETSKYGWFWECPNGDKCIYRHALPSGYVLKKDKKKMEEFKEEEISLEDLIEKERAALGSNLTRITFKTFLEWKKKKLREKKDKKSAEENKKRNEYRAGRAVGLSGRDLFTFNPDLVMEDDAEADDTHYQAENEESERGEEEAVEIDENMFVIDENGEVSEFEKCYDVKNEEDNTFGLVTADGCELSAGAAVHINEDLFDLDEMPDSDVDAESESVEDEPGTSGLCKGISDVHLNGKYM